MTALRASDCNERYSRPLALLILDLDHFKSINDTWGREAGDEVLRRVARAITTCVRDADTAASRATPRRV